MIMHDEPRHQHAWLPLHKPPTHGKDLALLLMPISSRLGWHWDSARRWPGIAEGYPYRLLRTTRPSIFHADIVIVLRGGVIQRESVNKRGREGEELIVRCGTLS